MVHAISILSGVALVLSYTLVSLILQLSYYHYQKGRANEWKVQPSKQASLKGDVSRDPWIPLINRKAGIHHPYQWVLASFNLFQSSLFTIFTVEAIIDGTSKCYLSLPSVQACVLEVLLCVLWESFVEYWWHRLMHYGPFYTRFHKIHHYFKSPEPFDDLLIHPLEAFGYYCILFSPPFVFRHSALSFFIYFSVMGVCGILDHSGVEFSSFLYKTKDHDAHHAFFNVNFGFPNPLFDLIHGTYRGEFAGYVIDGHDWKKIQ
jgi:sterol desaturase/sphingolipid hydroxylase (fatty acid hydroxylase superfamily)